MALNVMHKTFLRAMHVHVFEDPGINSTLACTGVGRSIRDSRVTSIKFQNADEFVI